MKGNGGLGGENAECRHGVMARGVPQVLTPGFYGSRYKEPYVGSRGRSLPPKPDVPQSRGSNTAEKL